GGPHKTAIATPGTLTNGSVQTAMNTIMAEVGTNLNGAATTVQGERPNLWLYEAGPGNYQAIKAMRAGVRSVVANEQFSTIRGLLEGDFNNYPSNVIDACWKNLSFTCHGWEWGSVDEFKARYQTALAECQKSLTTTLQALAGQVKTQTGKGTPLVVFNPLSWARERDVVTCRIPKGFKPGEFILYASNKGKLSSIDYQATGDNKMVFVASDVPALGYKTFYLKEGIYSPSPGTHRIGATWTAKADFTHYSMTPSTNGVGIKSIVDKELGEILNTSSDITLGADLLLLDADGLMGAGPDKYYSHNTVRTITNRLTKAAYKAGWTCKEAGPIRVVYETDDIQTSDYTYRLKVTVYQAPGIKRIDLEPSIIDWTGAIYSEVRFTLPLKRPTPKAGDVAYAVPYA
ncbi:MAG: hypothetical protein AAF492_28090, partial [Verrucomicrobiota bacterium]